MYYNRLTIKLKKYLKNIYRIYKHIGMILFIYLFLKNLTQEKKRNRVGDVQNIERG